MGWIEDIPYGLILCRLDGVQVSVTAIKQTGLRVRLSEARTAQRLEVAFLEIRRGTYRKLQPEKWQAEWEMWEGDALYRQIRVEDEAFRAHMQALLREFGMLIRDRSELDETELAAKYAGCAADGEVSDCLLRQKEKWFAGGRQDIPGGPWELALSLDHPGKYHDYLHMPMAAFQKKFLQESGLGEYALFHRAAKRLYVGNAWCYRLCPDEALWKKMILKAEGEGLEVSLVLPAVGAADMWVPEADSGEVVVNDWGSIHRLRGRRLALGTMLNRRRKDPRIGGQTDGRMQENGLNDPVFRAWLFEMGVERLEYESGGYAARVAEGKGSLHLPFYQTNTSHSCVLSAACRGLDAGVGHGACGGECGEYALLYPDGMRLVGRYNSIFAADTDILQRRDVLEAWLQQGIDRLVVEGL